jgi:hypothetical protein
MAIRIFNNRLPHNNGLHLDFVASTPDSDATAFITATGITNSVQLLAIRTLVKELKENNLWSKMKAIYPMVGGTATTHKFNLKDARDSDAAFRLSFLGGWTHTASGAKPNGTNAYADTFYIPNSNVAINSKHMAYYSTEDITRANECFIGGTNALNDDVFIPRTILSLSSPAAFIPSVGTTRAFFIGSRIKKANVFFQRNNNIISISQNSTSNVTAKIYLSARNFNGTALQYCSCNCAFASLGDGLSQTEMAIYYRIVQNYQTILSRQV